MDARTSHSVLPLSGGRWHHSLQPHTDIGRHFDRAVRDEVQHDTHDLDRCVHAAALGVDQMVRETDRFSAGGKVGGLHAEIAAKSRPAMHSSPSCILG